MTDKIIIYGTNTWPYALQARSAYGEKAIFVNIDEEPDKLEEMLSYTGGKRQVPVIVEGDRVKIGFAGNASIPQGLDLMGAT